MQMEWETLYTQKEQSDLGVRRLFKTICPNTKNFTNFTANISESELLGFKGIYKDHEKRLQRKV